MDMLITRYIGFKAILTVFFLFTVAPFSAFSADPMTLSSKQGVTAGEDLQLLSNSKKVALPLFEQGSAQTMKLSETQEHVVRSNLRYSLDWEKRIKAMQSFKGGVVDGGGGNESSKTILDETLNNGVFPLKSETLVASIESAWSGRFDAIEKTFPGFRLFLYSGFTLQWIADSKEFSDKVCFNSSIYRLEQNIVACQSSNRVSLQKQWFDEASMDSSRLTKILIHELIRFHVIRVGRLESLNLVMQDDLVARLTLDILNPNISGKNVYNSLVENKILMSEQELFVIRLREYTSMVNSVKDLLIDRHELRTSIKYQDVSGSLAEALKAAVESNQKALSMHIKYCDALFTVEELSKNGLKSCSDLAKKWN